MRSINISFFLLMTCAIAYAQQDSAIAAFSKKNWKEAEQLFKNEIEKDPDNLIDYIYLGSAFNSDHQYAEAISVLSQAFAVPDHRNNLNTVRLQMAKAYLGLNNKTQALRYLKDAASNYATFYSALSDNIFSSIKSDPEFISIIQKMKENNSPCTYDERYKKFDFFIGTWDVYLGKNYDQKVAVDSVSLASSTCSVHENFIWVGGGNFRGVSMIYFDPGAQHYRMCWTGSNGDIRTFEETRSKKDTIELMALTTTNNNEFIHRKMTMAIDPVTRNIHQVIENSFDLGRTWEVVWDAKLVKRK